MSAKQSQKFNDEHRLNAIEKVEYGYKDGGRGVKFNEDGSVAKYSWREVITVKSPDEDPSFKKAVEYAQKKTAHMSSTAQKAEFLAKFVDKLLPQNDENKNLEIMAEVLGGDFKAKEITLGQLIDAGTGVCRHRSLLFKALADEVDVPASLVRGNYDNGAVSGGHAWNEVVLEDNQRILVDVMHRNIFNMDHPDVQHYKDIQKNDMYTKMQPPANTVGHHAWTNIEKGINCGMEVDIQNWPETKKDNLLNDLKNMGIEAEVKTSNLQNTTVVRIMGEIDSAAISGQVAQERARHPNANPVDMLANAQWLDATNRDGDQAKYLDLGQLSQADATNFQRTLYSEGINFDIKNSSANGGMQVIAVTGDDLNRLNQLQQPSRMAQNGLQAQAMEMNKMHIPPAAPAQPQAPQAAQSSKRLSGKIAGFVNRLKPAQMKPKS